MATTYVPQTSRFVLISCPLQVVQYILDLNDSRFSDGVIRQFAGNVCALSVQKFSSNVIEKVRCLQHLHGRPTNYCTVHSCRRA
jgi:hypothetical protein